MKYLLIAVVVFLAACQPVVDTPALRSAIATKYPPHEGASALGGSIRITLLTPPPVPTIAPQLVPTVTPAPCRTIAGNINAQGKKLWHDESSPQWSQIRIDESKGERWFCSPSEAEAAGWTKASAP